MFDNRFWLASLFMAGFAVSGVAAEGDAGRGGRVYRACIACHSLEPGIHLTGPSLAGVWGKPAGKTEGYKRYSQGLKAADFTWNADTLEGWLSDPAAMVPGTYMVFRGIGEEQSRADLIAFLARAMDEGGSKSVVQDGLIPEDSARGQQPEPLTPAPDNALVTAIRHCGDGFFVTTADGVETAYWERNLRLKVDSTTTGPAPGKPVITASGMMGDRVSVIFSAIGELKAVIANQC